MLVLSSEEIHMWHCWHKSLTTLQFTEQSAPCSWKT
ncbi:hypothetical protein ANCCAN_27248 [Ancylostoma caninum]|uniref:Uncharacterized protein n=1 Tax=Ancylostoma caninum TaxID=29170 RepID=A0A368F7X0_ANCCA|nr:hypothetical protein ANCCAN_27248 [Ancylostoma caninum]